MFHRGQKKNIYSLKVRSRRENNSLPDEKTQMKNTSENTSRFNFFGDKTSNKQRNSNYSYQSKGHAYYPFGKSSYPVDDSDLTDSVTDSDMSDDMETEEISTPSNWRSAVDKKSGKIYYYNMVSMESTWEKPMELSSKAERLERERNTRQLKDFFQQMEGNILNSLSGGTIPGGFHSAHDKITEQRSISVKPNDFSAHDVFCSRAISYSDSSIQSMNDEPNTNIPSAGYYSSGCDERAPAVVSPDQTINHIVREGSNWARGEFLDVGIETVQERNGNVVTSHVHKNIDNAVYSASSELGTELTIKCVCVAYRAHIIESTIQKYDGVFECSESFNDPTDTMSSFKNQSSSSYMSPLADPSIMDMEIDSLDLALRYKGNDVPSLRGIINFYTEIFSKSQMENDCIATSLIYVERLMKRTHSWLRPTSKNWKSLLLMCIIMASKVWDDISMVNSDFANICSVLHFPVSLKRINELEVSMLQRLKFRVNVSTSEYAKYNVFIRSLTSRPIHLE